MQTVEFNTKYNRILSAYSLLRVHRVQEVKWGIKSQNRLLESCRLFLYLRTMMRYIPGVNITDPEIDTLFKKALTLISGLSFLEYEKVLPASSNYSEECGCSCGLSLDEIRSIISGNTKPAPYSIFYNDIHWNNGHTVYTNPILAGLTYKVMNNTGNRFLTPELDGFAILTTGGFTITEPMYEGQEFIPIF